MRHSSNSSLDHDAFTTEHPSPGFVWETSLVTQRRTLRPEAASSNSHPKSTIIPSLKHGTIQLARLNSQRCLVAPNAWPDARRLFRLEQWPHVSSDSYFRNRIWKTELSFGLLQRPVAVRLHAPRISWPFSLRIVRRPPLQPEPITIVL